MHEHIIHIPYCAHTHARAHTHTLYKRKPGLCKHSLGCWAAIQPPISRTWLSLPIALGQWYLGDGKLCRDAPDVFTSILEHP